MERTKNRIKTNKELNDSKSQLQTIVHDHFIVRLSRESKQGFQMSPEWVNATAALIGVLVALLGAICAIVQLSNINKTLKFSSLAALLQLETEMNSRKRLCDETIRDIRLCEATGSKASKEKIDGHKEFLKGATENWFNSVDRLAYCIKKEYFSERDWKAEYRDYIREIVCNHPELFGPGSIYTNIIDLNNKWMRD